MQLQQRKNIKHSHLGRIHIYLVKMHKFEIKAEPYGYKILMYYEYVGKTLK